MLKSILFILLNPLGKIILLHLPGSIQGTHHVTTLVCILQSLVTAPAHALALINALSLLSLFSIKLRPAPYKVFFLNQF